MFWKTITALKLNGKTDINLNSAFEYTLLALLFVGW